MLRFSPLQRTTGRLEKLNTFEHFQGGVYATPAASISLLDVKSDMITSQDELEQHAQPLSRWPELERIEHHPFGCRDCADERHQQIERRMNSGRAAIFALSAID
jgi:hypothetical protein